MCYELQEPCAIQIAFLVRSWNKKNKFDLEGRNCFQIQLQILQLDLPSFTNPAVE